MPHPNNRSPRHCMTAIVFDTLAYAERLESSGFTREQAHGQARALRELFTDQIATSQDVATLDGSFSARLERTEADLAAKMDRTEGEFARQLKQTETDLTNKISQTEADLTRRIEKTEADLTYQISQTKTDLTKRIEKTEIDLTMKLAETKADLIKWHIGSMLAMTALIVGLVKFVN